MGHSTWNGTERPSRSDSDCGDARYAPKNIEKARGKPAGTTQETPEMQRRNANGGQKRQRNGSPSGSGNGSRGETRRDGT